MMLIVALGVFHLQFFSQGLPLAAFVLLLFVFGITLGILATAMVLRFGPASEWLMWPLAALLSPFAAVFYPVAMLPAWMQWIAHALPPSYVFEGMRSLLAGRRVPGGIAASRNGGRGARAAGGRLRLRARVPARGPHGASRPLQRGGRDMTTPAFSRCPACRRPGVAARSLGRCRTPRRPCRPHPASRGGSFRR